MNSLVPRKNIESKKWNFEVKKKNTIRSLKEVEFFLRSYSKALRGFNIYKFLKR